MKKYVINGFACILLLSALPVQAILIWDWTLTDPITTVGPNDSVVINATIFNDAASTESIFQNTFLTSGMGFGSIFGPGNPYNFSAGVDGFLSNQFKGVEIAPGTSLDFVFGVLDPKSSPVPFGTYSSDYLLIAMRTDGIQHINELTIQVVPEPSIFSLIFIGITGLFVFNLRKSSPNNKLKRTC